jgi:nitrile hydratase
MHGIHDLGGKLGYGPVDVNEPEVPFHADYEGRSWAISRTARAPSITIDWWRYVRELINTDDYLNRSYFDSWAQTNIASMIDTGLFSLEEFESSIAQTVSADVIEVQSYEDVLEQNKNMAYRFDHPVDTAPKFALGQSVVTNKVGHRGHTRLPEYARGKTGVIHSYRDAHIFPDESAKGNEYAEHLYTVLFKATELWGDSANPNDVVTLDLWESYLAPSE